MPKQKDDRTKDEVICKICGTPTEWRASNGEYSFCKNCFDSAVRELKITSEKLDEFSTIRIFQYLVKRATATKI